MYHLIAEFYCYIDRAGDSVPQSTAVSNIYTVLAIDVYDMHITTILFKACN